MTGCFPCEDNASMSWCRMLLFPLQTGWFAETGRPLLALVKAPPGWTRSPIWINTSVQISWHFLLWISCYFRLADKWSFWELFRQQSLNPQQGIPSVVSRGCSQGFSRFQAHQLSGPGRNSAVIPILHVLMKERLCCGAPLRVQHVGWPSGLYLALSPFSWSDPLRTLVRAVWEAEDASLHSQICQMWKMACRRWGSERGALAWKHPASVTGCLSLMGESTHFISHLKSQDVCKVTSQQQILALINIPWAITCKKRDWCTAGNSSRETEGEWVRGGGRAVHPAAQIRVWGWKTHSEYGEGGELGSWDRDGGTAAAGLGLGLVLHIPAGEQGTGETGHVWSENQWFHSRQLLDDIKDLLSSVSDWYSRDRRRSRALSAQRYFCGFFCSFLSGGQILCLTGLDSKCCCLWC